MSNDVAVPGVSSLRIVVATQKASMLTYYNRILRTYLRPGGSNLSFWHEKPALNPAAFEPDSCAYYMTFAGKAVYSGPFDDKGVPLLDYRGDIGRQYNPIAIAQYGLALVNKADFGLQTADRRPQTELGRAKSEESDNIDVSRSKFHIPQSALACADWLVDNLEENHHGVKVWMHQFDWPYFRVLKAPWYSGLAQGQGISLLLRVWRISGDERYLDAALNAFEALTIPVADGGVKYIDEDGDVWLEEYITAPPTHILNGFIWGLWGVRDLVVSRESLVGSAEGAGKLWVRCVETLVKKLERFDSGYWSLYDLAPVGIKNPASPFYHRLHIVQLRIMHRLTGENIFAETADRWEQYAAKRFNRHRAFVNKCLFKLKYY